MPKTYNEAELSLSRFEHLSKSVDVNAKCDGGLLFWLEMVECGNLCACGTRPGRSTSLYGAQHAA